MTTNSNEDQNMRAIVGGILSKRTLGDALMHAEEARLGPQPELGFKTTPLDCMPGCGHYCSNYAADLVLLSDEVKRLRGVTMSVDEAITILNAHNHRDCDGWTLNQFGEVAMDEVKRPLTMEYFTPFEAIAVATALMRHEVLSRDGK